MRLDRRVLAALLAVLLSFIAGLAPFQVTVRSGSMYQVVVSVEPGLRIPLYMASADHVHLRIESTAPVEVYIASCSDLSSPRGMLLARTTFYEGDLAIGPGDCLVVYNAGIETANVTLQATIEKTRDLTLWVSAAILLVSASYLAYRAVSGEPLTLGEEEV